MADGAVANPLDTPEAFYTCTIGGVQLPGVIPPGGITGWAIKTDYQVKAGKGTDGATITDTGDPPPTGKIKTQLWLNGTNGFGEDDPSVPNHFDQHADFVTMLRAARAAKKALDIVHPWINQCEVTSVVVTSIGQILDEGAGLYTVEYEFLKWVPQPVAAGGTPKSAQDKDGSKAADPNSLEPPDPNQAAKDEFQQKMKEASEN